MTNRLWIGLVICGALLLSVGTAPSWADDCEANLLGYSWQCKAENVDNHQNMDFELRFFNNQFNQSIAQIDIGSMKLQAQGPFACEMHRKFLSREFVSGRTFFASLFSSFGKETRTVTLTGDSYWYWIVNGNGQIANVVFNASVLPVTTNTSAFIYRCGSPAPIQPF